MEALGHVDGDQGEVVVAQEPEGAVAVAVGGQPGGVAELDADLAAADGLELVAAGAAGGEPLGVLEEDGAELARRVEGEQGVAERRQTSASGCRPRGGRRRSAAPCRGARGATSSSRSSGRALRRSGGR